MICEADEPGHSRLNVVALSSSAVNDLVSLKWLREVRTRMPPPANLSSVA
jgi:hypothetical protein